MSCPERLDLAHRIIDPVGNIDKVDRFSIDSLKFAAARGCESFRVPLARLGRLHDSLLRQDGDLECRLTGLSGVGPGSDKAGLHLQVSGRLILECQRCLGDVEFDCVIDSVLLLMPPGADWPEDELGADDYDAIPASSELSVLALVEDEVLLSLPIVPRHVDCVLPGEVGVAVGSGAMEQEKGSSPFKVLAGLKKH